MQKGQSQLPHEFITRELFPYIHLVRVSPKWCCLIKFKNLDTVIALPDLIGMFFPKGCFSVICCGACRHLTDAREISASDEGWSFDKCRRRAVGKTWGVRAQGCCRGRFLPVPGARERLLWNKPFLLAGYPTACVGRRSPRGFCRHTRGSVSERGVRRTPTNKGLSVISSVCHAGRQRDTVYAHNPSFEN